MLIINTPTKAATPPPASALQAPANVRVALNDSALERLAGQGQVLNKTAAPGVAPEELKASIESYQPTPTDQQDLLAATLTVGETVRNDLVFDPGAWEKHASVLVAAIIALNVARVTNAQLRGHFSVMAADAAKSQGAAIIESGQAAIYSAITSAVVSGAISGFALLKNLQGQGLKQSDISLHQRNALDAGIVERDLQQARVRDDWNPATPYKMTVFDDLGRMKTVDFKPQDRALNASEQAWFNGEISKAQNVARTSDWLTQMSGKRIEKRFDIGRALNAISMSLSQVVTSMVRLGEHAAQQKTILQQSAQSTQKSLGDEVGQKDSADAALLQKLMEIAMQLFQSRIEVIGKIA